VLRPISAYLEIERQIVELNSLDLSEKFNKENNEVNHLVESIHDEINNNTNGRTQSVDLQNYKIRKYYSMNDDLSSFDTEYLVVNLNESSEKLKKK